MAENGQLTARRTLLFRGLLGDQYLLDYTNHNPTLPTTLAQLKQFEAKAHARITMASHGAHRIYSLTLNQQIPTLTLITLRPKGNSYQPLVYYLGSPDYDYHLVLMGKSLRCSVGELKIKV